MNDLLRKRDCLPRPFYEAGDLLHSLWREPRGPGRAMYTVIPTVAAHQVREGVFEVWPLLGERAWRITRNVRSEFFGIPKYSVCRLLDSVPRPCRRWTAAFPECGLIRVDAHNVALKLT